MHLEIIYIPNNYEKQCLRLTDIPEHNIFLNVIFCVTNKFCGSYKSVQVMHNFKKYFDHNQYNYHPFQTNVMGIIQMGRHQLGQFNAMIQFVVHHLQVVRNV